MLSLVGPTDWAPDTFCYEILDINTLAVLGHAFAGSATDVRKNPPGFVTDDWLRNGALLRAVAYVAVTKRGWVWQNYDGNISSACRDYSQYAKTGQPWQSQETDRAR